MLIEKIKYALSNPIEIPLTIDVSYKDFSDSQFGLMEIMGKKAIVLISKDIAALTFLKYSHIKFIIKSTKVLSKNDFIFDNFDISIYGGRNLEKTFFSILREDLKNCSILILLLAIFISAVFGTQYPDFSKIDNFNNHIINLSGILTGVVFVFIGYFYGDKDRSIDRYKKGLLDNEIQNDKYVFIVTALSFVFSVFSSIINNYWCTVEFINKLFLSLMDTKIYMTIGFILSLLSTFISLVLLIVCFDGIINYYLAKIRNHFFIEAFESLLLEHKNKDKK